MDPRSKNDTLYTAMVDVYGFLLTKPTENNFKKMIFFMFQAIELFIEKSPEISKKYFSVAKGYWFERKIRKDALFHCREEIYRYILSIEAELEWDDPDVCSIKAVKCLFTVYSKDRSDEMADTFEAFVDFVMKWVAEGDLLKLFQGFKKLSPEFKN